MNNKCLEGNGNCQQACRMDRKMFFHHSEYLRILPNQKNYSEPVVNPAEGSQVFSSPMTTFGGMCCEMI